MKKTGDIFHDLRQGNDAQGAAVLAHRLFPSSAWYIDGVLNLKQKEAAKAPVLSAIPVTEKDRAIESFKEFAHKKIEETDVGKVTFSGGEVALQEGAALGRKIKAVETITAPTWCSEELEVIFYGETSKLKRGDETPDNRAQELLDKMILAMRIPNAKVTSVLVQSELDQFDELVVGLHESKPRFVVSLGAVATNLLLGRKEKLTRVHGQFFPLKIERNGITSEFMLMPLFHPDFLLINPNMKRTAWLDLQKIMSELGISIA